MILLHRVTPFFLAGITAWGFYVLLTEKMPPLFSVAVSVGVSALLAGRLLGFRIRESEFWYLWSLPILFLLSSFGFVFLLEQENMRIAVAATAALFVLFFSEHIFTFFHLPVRYQMHAIENISTLLLLLTVFFMESIAFFLRAVLHPPIFLFLPFLLVGGYFLMQATLWTCKLEGKRVRMVSLGGSVLLAESFLVFSFLPSGPYTNALFVTLIAYAFLGVTRAFFLEKLSRSVVRRYTAAFVFLIALIVSTSTWY
ncbi:hypothetical protein HYV73_01400 [Candidatus Uhrbacteria bacterium]|nr:hypothetical protein [Candidatus Uhrbacteria bacterium]